MRKIISEVAILVGFVLVVLGLVLCMCETAELDKQFMTMIHGAGVMVAGAILCYLGNEGSECYGNR